MKRLFGILALGLLLLAGCTQKQQAPGSISVTVLPGALTLNQGASGLATLQVNRTNYSGNVQVFVAGVPSSVSVGVNTSSANTSGLVTLSVAADKDATPGNYPIQINVMGTGVSAAGILNLVVANTTTPAPAELSVTVGTPLVTIGLGGSGSANLTLARTNLPDNVTLGVTGVPAGVLATINPGITTGNSATLSIAVGTNATPGNYTMNIQAGAGSLTRTTSLQLSISNAPDYNLSVGAASIQVGTSGSTAVVVSPTGGFSGTVALACSGAPAGVSCAFPAPSVTVNGGPATANLNLTVASSVVPGVYTFTVGGTSGSNVRNATVTLTVTPSGSTVASFELSANSVSMGQGASATSAFTVTPSNGFAGVVNLGCTNVPVGFTCIADPSQVFLGSGMTETGQLRITTAASVTPGVYNLTLRGNSSTVPGGLTRTLNLQVVVGGSSAGFELLGGSLSVQQGQSGGMALSVTPTGGFTGSVSFNCSGGVQGVICNVLPNPMSFAGSASTGKASINNATLTVAVASGVPVGNYNLTLTATSGALSRTLTVPLAVTSTEIFSLSAYPREQSRLQGQRSKLTAPYPLVSIGVPIVKININRARGGEQPVAFAIAQVTDPNGVTRPVSDLFTQTTFDDDTDDLASGSSFTAPVAPFESITDGRYVRLFADINPEATLGRWQVTLQATDSVLGETRTVPFGLRIDPPVRLSVYPSTIPLRQGQQRGDTGDNSLPLSMVVDPRIVDLNNFTMPVGVVAVDYNDEELQNLGPLDYFSFPGGPQGYFFPGPGNNGTPLGDLAGQAVDCSFSLPVHTCWSGPNISDDLATLLSVTVRDNNVVPAVRDHIAAGSYTGNPRYLRLRFSPEAPTGTYRVTLALQRNNDYEIKVAPQLSCSIPDGFKTPSVPSVCTGVLADVDSAGGGIVDYDLSPAIPTATLTVNLASNYFTLSGSPTALTFAEYSATALVGNVTLTPTLVGDLAGGGSVENPGTLTNRCVAMPNPGYAGWTFNINASSAVFLAPRSNITATLTKNDNTAGSSIFSCHLAAQVDVPVGFAWWARQWYNGWLPTPTGPINPYYRRVVKVTVTDN